MFLSSNWRNIGKCEHFPSDEDPRRRELLTNAYLSFYFPMVLVGWSNCVLFSLVVSPQLHGVFPGPLPGTLVVFGDVSLVEAGDLWDQGVVWVGVA